MNIDPTDNRGKRYMLRRSIFDYGMGAMIIGFGIFFLFADKFNVQFAIDPAFRYAFVVLCILYGGFRIYRGYKKNYFSE